MRIYNYLYYKTYLLAQRSKNFDDIPVLGGMLFVIPCFMFNIFTFFPKTLKPVHFFPAAFTVFLGFIALSFIFRWYDLFNLSASVLLLYAMAILIDAVIVTKSIYIAYLSVIASFIQLVAYGIGFMTDFFKRVLFKVQ